MCGKGSHQPAYGHVFAVRQHILFTHSSYAASKRHTVALEVISTCARTSLRPGMPMLFKVMACWAGPNIHKGRTLLAVALLMTKSGRSISTKHATALKGVAVTVANRTPYRDPATDSGDLTDSMTGREGTRKIL